MEIRPIVLALGVWAAAALLGAGSATASTQVRSQSDPAAWWWAYGQTAAQVAQLVNANGARIVDLEVEQSSPSYSFTVALVENDGAYDKTWWWYYGLTAAELNDHVSTNDGRVIDLEAYEVGGEVRFAAVMVSNDGPQSKAWWWYYNLSATEISNAAPANNARLVDVDTYFIGGQRYYAVVMISNTDADQKAWWWYADRTPEQIASSLDANDARVTDIERHSANDDRYTVIMEACPCPSWSWYYGLAEMDMIWLTGQDDVRVIDVETYDDGGGARFAVAMIDNAEYQPGDANCDGNVNPIDAALILQHAAGLVGSLACQHVADVSENGSVDAIDAALILQYAAGLIQSLPP